MPSAWTRERLLTLTAGYQTTCVLIAAAELDVFAALAAGPATAEQLAERIVADRRGTTVLLDALVASGLIDKTGNAYSAPAEIIDLLAPAGRHSILPMVLHHGNCLRRWSDLARAVKTGQPPERRPSLRGADADQAAFIGAMHVVSGPVADAIVRGLAPPPFAHLLDVGGASGTWTAAFLRAAPPSARATIFDLPDVIPMARQRMGELGLADRVALVPGDFYTDPLPAGADLVWLSAIAHQNSREQNRDLFRKIHAALPPGGSLYIRDIVMDDSHTDPPGGAMFAVNMFVATPSGGTYSLREYREDLESAGFTDVQHVRHDPWMDAVIRARKPVP